LISVQVCLSEDQSKRKFINSAMQSQLRLKY
jgi:hypothetical protein